MKNVVFVCINRMLLILLGVSLVVGCKSNKPYLARARNEHDLIEAKRLPIEVVPLRDGETTRIVIHGLSESGFHKLCFVRSSDPKVGGEIYINENWRTTNEKPLSLDDSKNALNQGEKSLNEFFGDFEIKRISANRMAIKNMPPEEILQHMKNPKLNDELDASFALDLIYEYREYIDLRSGRR